VNPDAIEEADFLSAEAKVRALAEPTVPPEIVVDESISHFFTRRFGFEFSRLVAEPILAGTHAGDPARLSMRALYPHFLDREAQYGNLGFSDQPNVPAGATFLSFRNGMSTLSEALLKGLKRTRVTVGGTVASLKESDSGVNDPDTTQPERFAHVILTMQALEAKRVLAQVKPESSNLVGEIEFASSTIVTAAYDADSLPGELQGTGFLAPYDEFAQLTGSTWTSSKWADRAPENRVLFRYFYGGDGRPPLPPAEELITQTRANAQAILGIRAEPLFTKVFEYPSALPQYTLGHTALVDQIEESLAGTRFTVAGSSYRGVGIPDCIRQGRDAARKIAKELG
jgi:oxygen-dependent protoporphyrinogen oxidase